MVKEGKYLRTTPLGEVVTGLMKDKFTDIVDTAFTAHMEEQLDEVEEGKVDWKSLLGQFYGGFEKELKKAEEDTERIKVPDEVSDVICPKCGRNLVYKSGRFGRFLACPGWPELPPTLSPSSSRCRATVPSAAARSLKKTSKRGYAYYGCENNTNKDEASKCDFMTWDVPVKDNCPVCGQTMFKKSGRGFKKPFCINPECPNFLPEDQRGLPEKDRRRVPRRGRASRGGETCRQEGGKENCGGQKAGSCQKDGGQKGCRSLTACKIYTE